MSTTIVRAYNAEGYHLDILRVDYQQVRVHDTRLRTAPHMTPPFDGPRMTIRPSDFPEMVEFEVIVTK